MAFYGKYNRRRNYNRSRRRLSNRFIYSKTSAKQQAKQIATLRNRINTVYKKTRPEIKVLNGSIISKTLDSQTLLNTYWTIGGPNVEQGAGDNQRIGDKINVKNMCFTFTAEYYNSSQTGYHGGESAGTTMRIIVGQFKSPKPYNVVPTIKSILNDSSNTGATYTHQALVPLKNGISQDYNILRDMRFTMTSARNQRLIKINVKPRSIRWDADGNYNNLWVMVISAGLHNDTDFSEFVEMTANIKLAYTDA